MSARPVTELTVEAAYDRWAQAYDAADNPMVFAATRALAASLPDVSGRDVFEFGCGTGRNLAFLKAAGARSLAGCDLSDGMLAQARRRLPDGAALLRHDMRLPLPLPAAGSDLVLFCLSLEHIAALEPPLAEARRLLRPGGEIVIVEIHPFVSQSGVAAHFIDAGEEVRMPAFPHRFSDYLTAFAALDLRVAACREWRPRDLGPDVPARALKRGADTPLVVEWCVK